MQDGNGHGPGPVINDEWQVKEMARIEGSCYAFVVESASHLIENLTLDFSLAHLCTLEVHRVLVEMERSIRNIDRSVKLQRLALGL